MFLVPKGIVALKAGNSSTGGLVNSTVSWHFRFAGWQLHLESATGWFHFALLTTVKLSNTTDYGLRYICFEMSV